MIKKYNIPDDIPKDGVIGTEKLLGFDFAIDVYTARVYNKYVDEYYDNLKKQQKIIVCNNVKEIIKQIKAKAKAKRISIEIG